jgi:large subunit ribosomal protein L23
MNSKTMTLRPRVSEKAYGMSQLHNTYVFVVPGDANRLTVAQAVAAQFNVTVEDVNILNVKGKVKRTVRKGGRATTGRDNDIKKAYVTLKQGDTIAIFASEEDKKADDKKAAKAKKDEK